MNQTPLHAESRPLIRAFGRPLSRNALFWTLQAGGWIAYGVASLGFALSKEKLEPAIFDATILASTGFILTSLYRYLYRRWRRLGTSLPLIAVGIVMLAVIGVPLWYEPQTLLTRIASTAHPSWWTWIPSYTEIPADCWLQWVTVLLGWSFLYFGINDWMSLQAERRRAAAAEAMAQGARLRALQSQLQPHFLFNTLNSISSLILDGRSTTAVSMISQLGELLRVSLQTSETPQIPLEKEVSFLRYYLEIERTRFGDRLQYRFDIAPPAHTAMVPTLLLQPLVENAVRHGILPKAEGGTVAISGRVHEKVLKLRIEDDGRGILGPPLKSSGIGLANTARRLEELFGNQAKLAVCRGAVGVAIDIELPFSAQRERHAMDPAVASR